MAFHDLAVLVKGLSALKGNTAFASTPFSKLASFNHGGIFLGRFTGQAPWERHRHGDELVHVLDGEVDLTVMTARRPVHVTLRAGCMFVVSRGLWHRQHARAEATLLSATPTPTDISFADDPRCDKRLDRAGGKRARSRRPRSDAGRSSARSARATGGARRPSSGRSMRRPGSG